eukprot:Partr_v1_DN27109_c0_g1_i1_m15688 putative Small nuclear RNA activating complex, polypeptide 4, 190kDa
MMDFLLDDGEFPALTDFPFPVAEESEQARLAQLLNVNRQLQKEIRASLSAVDHQLAVIRDYQKRLSFTSGSINLSSLSTYDYSDGGEDSVDVAKRAHECIREVVSRRLHPRLFFPPYFVHQGSVPPPNDHVRDSHPQDSAVLRGLYFSQKPIAMFSAEADLLLRTVFSMLLQDLGPDMSKRLISLGYSSRTLECGDSEVISNIFGSSQSQVIVDFSMGALKFVLDSCNNPPSTWPMFKWQAVSSEFTYRSPQECRFEFLYNSSPQLNQSVPDAAELADLENVAMLHQFKDWDLIALDLGTGRSPLHLFRIFMKHFRGVGSRPVQKWTDEESKLLVSLVDELGPQWAEISSYFNDRSNTACKNHYRIVDPSLTRGKWTPREDELLVGAVELFRRSHPDSANMKWGLISQFVPGRSDFQCRNRFDDKLDPAWNWNKLSNEEAELLIQVVREVRERESVGGVLIRDIASISRSHSADGKLLIPWRYIAQKYFPGRQDVFLRRSFKSLALKQSQSDEYIVATPAALSDEKKKRGRPKKISKNDEEKPVANKKRARSRKVYQDTSDKQLNPVEDPPPQEPAAILDVIVDQKEDEDANVNIKKRLRN